MTKLNGRKIRELLPTTLLKGRGQGSPSVALNHGPKLLESIVCEFEKFAESSTKAMAARNIFSFRIFSLSEYDKY